MTDNIINQPIEVHAKNSSRPYVPVPLDQLDTVTGLLAGAGIPYYIHDEYLSVNDDPEIAFVFMLKPADANLVQQLLDSVT